MKNLILVNSTAALRPEESGNKTEIGFLKFFERTEYKYEDVRAAA